MTFGKLVLPSRSSDVPKSNVGKNWTNCGGAQTAQLEKVEQMCTILQEFEPYQELNQVSGVAGLIKIGPIRSS